VIGLYDYFQEATMKQIGAEIGVNESRVSQLHARAIRRLKDALHSSMVPGDAQTATASVLAFYRKPQTEAHAPSRHLTLVNPAAKAPAVVVNHPACGGAAGQHLAGGPEAHCAVSTVTTMPRRTAEVIAIAR
jgi:hypothetical protein